MPRIGVYGLKKMPAVEGLKYSKFIEVKSAWRHALIGVITGGVRIRGQGTTNFFRGHL